MDAAKFKEIGIEEALCPQTDPIEASVTHGLKLGLIDGSGIRLTRDLSTFNGRMDFKYRFKDGKQLWFS